MRKARTKQVRRSKRGEFAEKIPARHAEFPAASWSKQAEKIARRQENAWQANQVPPEWLLDGPKGGFALYRKFG